jgi:glycine cleavage system regulatory protein
MATIAELRKGLAAMTVPDHVADVLLTGASALWLSSDTAAQLAGDLALCHPPLKRNEVRARAAAGEGEWRLTVVARDRKGLLADTAAILASAGYCVRGASATTWGELDLALHALVVDGEEPSAEELDDLGGALRAATKGARPLVPFTPTGRAYVRRSGEANGDAMLSVVAPDQPGLLATVCRWFADAEVSIEAAWIAGEDGEANDVFVVDGDVDCAALEKALTADDEGIQAVVGDMFSQARDVGENLVRGVTDFVSGLFSRR